MTQHQKFEWHTPFFNRGKAIAAAAVLSVGVSALAVTGAAAQEIPDNLPTLTEQEERGKIVYYITAGEVGCAICHGSLGQGSIDVGAPAAAGATRAALDGAMDGGAQLMTFFTITPQEREDVWHFLQVLGRMSMPSYDPESEEGRIIFERTAGGVGCAACHGMDATGDVGPDIRGRDPVAILDAMSAVDEMGFIELSEVEIARVAAYLRALHEFESH